MPLSSPSSRLLFAGRSHRSNSADSKATQIPRSKNPAATVRQKTKTDSFENEPSPPTQSSSRSSSWPTTADVIAYASTSIQTGMQKVVGYVPPSEADQLCQQRVDHFENRIQNKMDKQSPNLNRRPKSPLLEAAREFVGIKPPDESSDSSSEEDFIQESGATSSIGKVFPKVAERRAKREKKDPKKAVERKKGG